LANLETIERIDKAGFVPARSALARAFFDYNLMVYAAPNDRRRGRGVSLLYGAILWDCLRYGEVFATRDVNGVSCWLPPQSSAVTFSRQVAGGMLKLPLHFGLRGFNRLVAYDKVAQKLHHDFAHQPHWYLAAIGVEPEQQGRGLGGALMQPILQRADAERLPCYLETHHESNVRLYQRHGFEITCHTAVPGHPIAVWAMLRKPR
jgi:ribosomal protein S18 acetylase RimI-like enzyme